MRIGRNEQCPCNSGKRYKDCCLKKKLAFEDLNLNAQNNGFEQASVKDYGQPDLSDDFFNKNLIKEFSAPIMLYSLLLNPGIDKLAAETTKGLITRGKAEAKKIRKEKSPDNLLTIMQQQPDPINHWLLKKKILDFSKRVIPKIIEKLKDNHDEAFVELAVSIIYESKIDCSSHLLGILDSIKDPYTKSLSCLLLGLIGKIEAIQLVWNCYHSLKDEYPQESYDQGPLLALCEFKERLNLN